MYSEKATNPVKTPFVKMRSFAEQKQLLYNFMEGYKKGMVIIMGEKKGGRYFYKVILLLFATVFIIAAVLTSFSYKQFSDALKGKTYADYQAGLRKNAQSWEDLVSQIGQLNSAITIDSQTAAYYSLKEFDPEQHYYTYLKVKKIFNIHPYLISIGIYNSKISEPLYCGTDEIDMDTFWVEMQQKNGKFIIDSKTTGASEADLLVFGYPIYTDSFDEPQSAVFICLDARKVKNHVLGEADYGQILINENRQCLTAFARNETDDEIVEWVKGKKAVEINEIVRLQGGKYLCSAYSEDDNCFISYVNYNEVMGQLNRQKNIFLFVCLIVMAVSMGMEFLVARKIYQPIKSMKQEFEKSKFADGQTLGEFELIKYVYESALTEIAELEEQNALYLPRIKADILRDLLFGTIRPEAAIEKLKEYQWEIPFRGMFLVDVKIDKKLENELLMSVVQAKIQQLFVDVLGNDFFIESISVDNDEVIVMLNTLAGKPVTFEELVKELEGIRDSIIKEYRVLLTIGLDGMIDEIQDCHAVYEKVKGLQKNRFALGENQVIYQARIMELLPEALNYPDKLINEILVHLGNNERAKFEEKIEDFLQTICQYVYPSASILFARLYLEMAARIQKYGVPEKSRIAAVDMKMNPGTLEEARGLLLKAYDACESRMDEAEHAKENKHYKKIVASQEFIMETFSDCNLSADSIAERLGYSTNYFARIFKTITGFYINDYIRQIRIMKAQEFLQNTNMTVNEIAKETGFTTPNYFYAIFKKETGMTPAAYREAVEE